MLTTLLGFLDLGSMNTAVAVFLAIIKASLIAAFFMHALHESATIRVVMAAGVIWFLIFVSLTAVDFMSRNW
jgi:cytochrome c oxidase subunit 4